MILIHIYTCKYEIRVTKNKTKKNAGVYEMYMQTKSRELFNDVENFISRHSMIVNILLKLKP